MPGRRTPKLPPQTQLLEAVLRHLPVAVIVRDAEGKLVAANYEAERIMGAPVRALFDPETTADIRLFRLDGVPYSPEALPGARALHGEHVSAELMLHVSPRGKRTVVEMRAEPILDAQGRVAHTLVAFADVTERKRVQDGQELLARAGEILASSLEYEETLSSIARLVASSMADFCVIDIIGDDGRVQRLQVAASDPERQELADRMRRYPLDRSRPHLTRDTMQTGRPQMMPVVPPEHITSYAQDEVHLRLLTAMEIRSFITVPLAARGRLLGSLALLGGDGRAPYGPADLLMAEELARRAALAIDNARLFRAAREATRARDDILAIVAHDLRNPLNAIHLAANNALRKVSGPAHTSVEAILRDAERMNRLIHDLLDVARIEAGRLSLEAVPYPPSLLVEEAIDMMAPLAHEAGLQLSSQVSGDLPSVDADHPRLLRVFSNLIGNAVKFTPEHGHITVEAQQDGEAIRFSVTDSGRGLPEEQLSQVFAPFWQARESDSRGAGLGLAISKAIVEAHRGRIWAEAPAGGGARFSFTLPVSKGDAPILIR